MVSTKAPLRSKSKATPLPGMQLKRNAIPKNLEPLRNPPMQKKDMATFQQLLLNPIMDGQGPQGSSVAPAFASVAATFNFQHHVGADTGLELEVLKTILIREGYISRMRDCVEGIMRGEAPELRQADGSGILDLLINIREASVEVVDSILNWRDGFVVSPRLNSSFRPNTSSLRPGTASRAMTPSGFQGAGNALADANSGLPPAFLYQGMNYLLKMATDLDFLAEIRPLVDAFKVPSENMRRNPFMTPFTLDDVMDSESLDGRVEGKHQRLLDAAQVIAEEEEVELERAALVKEQLEMPSYNTPVPGLSGPGNLGLGQQSSQVPSFVGDSNQLSVARPLTGGTQPPGTAAATSASPMFVPGNLEKHQKLMTWYEEACDQLYRLQYTTDPGFSTSYINQQNSGAAPQASTMEPPSSNYPEDVHDEKPKSSFPLSQGQRGAQTVPFRDPIGLFSGNPNSQGQLEIPSVPDPLNPGYTLPYSMSVPNMGMMSSFQSPLAPGAFIHAKNNQAQAINDPYSSRAVPVPGHAAPSGTAWEDTRQRIFQKQKNREDRMAQHSINWGKGKAGIMHKSPSAWVAESTRDDPFGRNIDAGFVDGMIRPLSGDKKKKKKKKKKGAGLTPDVAWEAVSEHIGDLSSTDLQELLDIEQPEKPILLIAAATIILLTPAKDMPSDVTFKSFKTLMLSQEDGAEGFLNKVLHFEAPDFPNFKIRALKPFLQNEEAHPVALEKYGKGIQTLALWVLKNLRHHEEFDGYADRAAMEWHEHMFGPPKKAKKKKKLKRKVKPPPPPQLLYKQIQTLGGEDYFVSVTESLASMRDEPSTYSVKVFSSKMKPIEKIIPNELMEEMRKDAFGVMWVEDELVPRLKVSHDESGKSELGFKPKPVKRKSKFIPPGSRRVSRSPSPEETISSMPGGKSYQKGLQKANMLSEKTATKQEKAAALKIQNQGRKMLAKKKVQQLQEKVEEKAMESHDLGTQKDATAKGLLAQATAVLDGIDRRMLRELKALHNPPVAVQVTIEALCILLRVPPVKVRDPKGGLVKDYWPAGAQLLKDPAKLLSAMMATCGPEKAEELKKHHVLKKLDRYMSDPIFTPETVKKVSSPCASICTWIRAMHQYYQKADEESIQETTETEDYSADNFEGTTTSDVAHKTKEEQDKAAIKIQSVARRRQAAVKVDGIKKQRQEDKAATKIQGLARQKHARAVVDQKRQEKKAAIVIQSKVRQVEAKGRVQAIREGREQESQSADQLKPEDSVEETTVDNSAYDLSTYTDEFDEDETAATLATQEQILLEQEQAATKIQSIARRRQAQHAVKDKREQRDAAVKIQSVARQRQARQKVAQKKQERESAMKIQGAVRQKQARKKVSKKRQEKAATKIQSSVRQRQARLRVAKIKQEKREADLKSQESEDDEEYDDDEYTYDDEYTDDQSDASPSPSNESPESQLKATEEGQELKSDTPTKAEQREQINEKAQNKSELTGQKDDGSQNEDKVSPKIDKETPDNADSKASQHNSKGGKETQGVVDNIPDSEHKSGKLFEAKEPQKPDVAEAAHASSKDLGSNKDDEEDDEDYDDEDYYNEEEDSDANSEDEKKKSENDVALQEEKEMEEEKEEEMKSKEPLTPEEAAVRIQCAQRKKVAREIVAEKRKMNDAALKLQTKSRQFLAKKLVGDLRDEKWRREHFQGEVIHMGKVYHIYTDDKGKPFYFNPEQSKRKPSSIDFQSQQSKGEEEEMLITLQENGEYTAIDDFELTKADILKMNDDSPTNEENDAATKIQSIARRNMAKDRVSQLNEGKEPATNPPTLLDKEDEEEEEEEEEDYEDDYSDDEEEEGEEEKDGKQTPTVEEKEKAATKIQNLARQKAAKKVVQRKKDEYNAAVKIQTKGRQFLANKKVEEIKRERIDEKDSEEDQDSHSSPPPDTKSNVFDEEETTVNLSTFDDSTLDRTSHSNETDDLQFPETGDEEEEEESEEEYGDEDYEDDDFDDA